MCFIDLLLLTRNPRDKFKWPEYPDGTQGA